MNNVAIGITLVLLVSLAPASVQAQPTGRNIIFISIDDMRNWAGYTGEYPGAIHTPNIDALAAQSTRYRNAYTTSPVCMPSRTSVLTGLSPATHGYGFGTEFWNTQSPEYQAIYNNPSVITLPEAMNGYYTAVTGKVFHTPEPSKWDESGPTPDVTSLYHPFFPGPDGTFLYASELDEEDDNPDLNIAEWASDFVSEYDDEQPFFLSVGFNLPHLPWNVPSWAYNHYNQVEVPQPIDNDLDDEPALGVNLAQLPLFYVPMLSTQHELIQMFGKAEDYTRAYLAGITHTDAMVGMLLDALAVSAHADNTDVILWSDHGFHLGEKFHWRKGTLWEPSVKVPLLVRAPDYPPGDVLDSVSLLDLAPTVLDVAGLPPHPQFEGVPLRDAENRGRVEIYYHDGRAIVEGRLKIIDYDLNVDSGIGDLAFYWMSYDPHESNNLIESLIQAILRAQAEED